MAKKVAIEIDIQGTKDVIELQKQIRATKKELKETEDIEAFDKLATDLVKLQSQLKEARKAQRQAVDAFTATDEGVGAYSRLSAQLRVARNNLKDLQASGTTTGAEVEKLTKEVNELDTSLKEIDRSVGQTNREVGAYEEAVRKAVGITDAQTGAFTRLKGRADVLRRSYRDVATESGKNSKEARQLAKELAKVERQLKSVSAQSDKTSKRIGGLRTQARSLGPAFAGLASGFFIFTEIPQVLEDLQAGLDFTLQAIDDLEASNSEFLQTQRAVNGQLDIAAEGFFKERTEVNKLFKPLRDDNISREEKGELIAKINQSYGEYLPKLLTDKATNEELAAAQRSVNEGLAERFALQAQETKLAEIANKIAQESVEGQKRLAERIALVNERNEEGEERQRRLKINTESANKFTQSRIDALTEEAKLIVKSTKDVAKALSGAGLAFDEATKDLDQTAEESEAARLARLAREKKKALDIEREASKKRGELRRKEQQQLLKDQESFLKQEAKSAQQRTDLLLKLQEATAKQLLENQADSEAKALAQETQATAKRIATLNIQQNNFINQLNQRQTEINNLFGEGSKQAIAFAQTAAKQRIEINLRINNAIEAENQSSFKRRADIRAKFSDKEAQERKQELQSFITQLGQQRAEIVEATNQELLAVREARAKGFIDQQEAEKRNFEARKKSLQDQIKQLRGEEFALTSQQEFGGDVAQSEFDKIANARQLLNTQLAELEEAQTAKATEEARKREEERLGELGKVFNTASEALTLFDGFQNALNERAQQRLAKEAEAQQGVITALQERLSEADGLEKTFLEQRVQEETRAAEEIAAAQERARKEQAIAQKAIAIGQAIINGALAVTAVLAQTTDPTPVQAFRFAAVAAAIAVTAAQVATIAAQPIAAQGGIEGETFAKGGMVHGRSHAQGGEKFRVGGRVVELEGGEAVINKRSTGMFRNQLSAMNVAGGGKSFQVGGVISPPMNAPTLAGSERESSNVLALIKTNTELIQATRELIPKIEVVYTTNTEDSIERDKVDRKEITTRATL